MAFLRTAFLHPRKLFLRRAVFQIHLWAGLLLALYVIVIALTGSVLVFEGELKRLQLPSQLTAFDPQHTASIADVLSLFAARYPHDSVSDLVLPNHVLPAFVLTGADASGHALTLLADPSTGAFFPQPHTWLDVVHDLHINLLLGTAYGMQINGVGAAILLLLSVTGIVLWWPGLRVWTRGLRIGFRHRWRRINYDAHSAIGFWTLLLVSWWAFSGIYFAWYRQVTVAVAIASPIRGMQSPRAAPAPAGSARVALPVLLQAIHHAAPGGQLYSLSDPALKGSSVYALVDLGADADFSHRDIITLSTVDARVLSQWHYGQNHTLGDWILWSMHPLHFGTLWGLPIKILWAACGLALALLSVTGVLMYWTRFLGPRLARL